MDEHDELVNEARIAIGQVMNDDVEPSRTRDSLEELAREIETMLDALADSAAAPAAGVGKDG